MQNQPLVSIGLLSYNSPSLLREAILSLLNQTYINFELIISDDYSSNNDTIGVINSYAKKDKRIRPIFQKNNIKRLKNFEYLLNESKGDYFMWASNDDLWDKNFIKTCLNSFKKYPDIDLFFPQFLIQSDIDKKTVNFNHNIYLTLPWKTEIFLLLDETLTHKANISYGLWKTDKLRKIFLMAKDKGLEEHNIGKGFDNAFLTIAMQHIKIRQIPKVLFTKRYIGRQIPGSLKEVCSGTFTNLKTFILNPISHPKYALKSAKRYVKVIEDVYECENIPRRFIILNIKKALYILRNYVF